MASENTIGKLFVQLLLDDEDFDFSEPEKQIKDFGSLLDGWASGLESAFSGVAKAVAASVAGVVGASVVVGASFQAQMTEVGVIAGAVGDDFGKLEEKARELGATTAFSATEAAGAMGLLAGAGLSVNEVMIATGDALTLAGAGGTTLDVAAASLASTLAQFQLRASEAGRVSDVFAKVTAESQFRVEDLSEAMKYGGTVGAGFGWSLEQTVAALAMFRDMGLQGSMAGTALRSSMVGATTASAKNLEVLEHYGLSLEKINPETHSFAEILKSVGESGMTTSDAMVVFGTEAGAAFMTLARAAAEGDTKYQEMVQGLEDSSGAASAMFGDMQKNVMGSFKELQSAAEEILLSIFDTMKEPLADVLDALTETLQGVITYFQANSGKITARLKEDAGAFISWLDENKELIAVTFFEGAQAVVTLGEAIAKLVPILDDLAILLGALFIAKKVLDFASAVQTVIQGVYAFQAALLAVNAELAISTGGLWLAVAAVGAFVVALAVLANGYGEAEDAARRLRMEQEAGAKVNEAEAQRLLERYGDEIALSKENESAKRKELAAAGDLTAARREELDLIRNSTEAQLASMVAQGKLVESGGELRTLASLYEDLEEDALIPVQARLREMEKDQGKLLEEAAKLDEKAKGYELLGENSNIAADNIAILTGEAAALRQQADDLGDAMVTLTAASDDAQAVLLETYSGKVEAGVKDLGSATAKLGEDSAEAAKKAEEAWAQAFASAMGSAGDALERAREGYEDSLADQRGLLENNHERELQDLERAQAKALAEVEENEVARMMVTAQYAEARGLIEKRQAVEIRHFEWEETKKTLEQKREAREKKAKEDQNAAEEAKRTRARDLDALTALERGEMKESERIEAERWDFFAEHATLSLEEVERAEKVFASRRKAAREQEREESGENAKKTAQAIISVFQGMMGALQAMGGGIAQVGGMIVDGLSKVVAMGKKAASAITGVFSAVTGGKVSLNVLEFLSTAIDKIISGEAGGATVGQVAASFVTEMAANAGLFVDSLVEGLPDIVAALADAIPSLVQKVAEALPLLAAQVAEMIPEVVAAIAEAVPVLVQGIVEALPLVIQALVEAIPTLVAVLAEAVPMLVGSLLENLPIIVQGIAEAIPLLVDVFVENLPVLVQGLVENLGPLVVALAAAIPRIIQAIADAIPVVVQALVDQLPTLLDAIVASLPILLESILEVIPLLIEQIPVIIQAILDLLPTLITSILDALPEIITAIIRAIPVIVMAIIEAIPEIVQALIEGLPQIVQALVEGIIFELIPAIPGIVIALLESLWEGIKSLAEALWDLIKDLFKIGGGKDDEKDKDSKYSGISYVPATMRGVTLHPGEAVLTASENTRRLFGGAGGAGQSNPSVPVVTPSQGGAASQMEALFAVDGRIMDGVILRANQNGRGKVTTMMKRRAGVRSGVKTNGRFKFWSR